MNTLAPRWGDNDRHLGPFTFATDKWRSYVAVMLTSADDEERRCRFRLSVFGFTFLSALPAWVLRPERRWVDTSRHEWSSPRGGYTEINEREFGFYVSEGHLSVHYGRQTMDSSTEQSWGCFLPWTQWRHFRHSLYGLDGSLFVDLPKYGVRHGQSSWKHHQALCDACPSVSFAFKDFDGEILTATTKIEEREWLFGEGWFRWLSLFRRPKVSRSLDLRFSGETGRRKGSWKGGTLGHSTDMLPGELHEAAFRRYCAAHDMEFIS